MGRRLLNICCKTSARTPAELACVQGERRGAIILRCGSLGGVDFSYVSLGRHLHLTQTKEASRLDEDGDRAAGLQTKRFPFNLTL